MATIMLIPADVLFAIDMVKAGLSALPPFQHLIWKEVDATRVSETDNARAFKLWIYVDGLGGAAIVVNCDIRRQDASAPWSSGSCSIDFAGKLGLGSWFFKCEATGGQMKATLVPTVEGD